MTLEDLRVFVAAYEKGNLSAVARALRCTQSAVSQHVGRLERELGATLFVRRASGVVPTKAGMTLFEDARNGLQAIRAGVHRVKALTRAGSEVVSITTGSTTVRHFLRGTVVKFRRRRPEVMLEFIPSSTSSQCVNILREGRANLAFFTLGSRLTGLETRCVANQRLHLLVPSDDPLAGRRRDICQGEFENPRRFPGLHGHVTDAP